MLGDEGQPHFSAFGAVMGIGPAQSVVPVGELPSSRGAGGAREQGRGGGRGYPACLVQRL